jgi:serine/threonine protein kinase
MWKITAQLFIGLSVINSFNLVHRDIKDNNIFIDEDKNLKLGIFVYSFLFLLLLLGDYGVSKELSFDSQKLSTMNVGTYFIYFFIYFIVKCIYGSRSY